MVPVQPLDFAYGGILMTKRLASNLTPDSSPLYTWTGKAVGAEVLSTIVGFLCRVPSVRNEEIALFSQQMTFW